MCVVYYLTYSLSCLQPLVNKYLLVPASTKIANVQNFLRKKLQLESNAQVKSIFFWFFTVRCYASAVLAMALCLTSVCLSITSRCSTKMAKRRITQTKPHDTPGTLVFWCQRSPRNSNGVTPYEGAECRWGGSKSATFDK